MAIPEHVELARRGSPVWTAWRSEHPEARPDLSGADLSNCVLSNCDLAGADLVQTKLDGASLVEANRFRYCLGPYPKHRGHLQFMFSTSFLRGVLAGNRIDGSGTAFVSAPPITISAIIWTSLRAALH